VSAQELDQYRAQRQRLVTQRRRKRRQLALLRGEETGLLDAGPFRERIQALLDCQWPYDAIVTMAGAGSDQGLRLIVLGEHQRVERQLLPLLDVPVSVAVPSVLDSEAKVPALGATRRVRAMLALGWSHGAISELTGTSSSVFALGRRPRTIARRWRAIDDAYERLSGRRGPSSLTAHRAATYGYLPPLAWDDIDDPAERPEPTRCRDEAAVDDVVVDRILSGRTAEANRATRTEVVRRWSDTGRSLRDLERLTGWNTNRYIPRDNEGQAS